MTNKEAAKTLITKMHLTRNGGLCVMEEDVDTFLDAICVSLSFLLKQEGTTTSIPKSESKHHNEKACKYEGKHTEEKGKQWHNNATGTPTQKGVYHVMLSCANLPTRAYYDGDHWFDSPTRTIPLYSVTYWCEIDS